MSVEITRKYICREAMTQSKLQNRLGILAIHHYPLRIPGQENLVIKIVEILALVCRDMGIQLVFHDLIESISASSYQLVVRIDTFPDRIRRIEHHHIDYRKPWDEPVAELPVLEGFRLQEFEIDSVRAELFFRVELPPSDCVDVDIRTDVLAQREYFGVAGQGMIDLEGRRYDDFGAYRQGFAGLLDRVQDEFEQIGLLVQHDPFDERKSPLEMRRTPVRLPDLVQQSGFLEVGGYLPVPDVQGIGIFLERDGKHRILSVQEKAVAVDPAFFGVLDVVVDDEQVGGIDQLEISDIGKEIRLHDGQALHAPA